MILGRQKYIQQYHKCLSQVALMLRWLLKSFKKTHNYGINQIPAELIKAGVEQFALRPLNFLIIFRIRRNCVRIGRSRSLCLFLRREVTQIVEL